MMSRPKDAATAKATRSVRACAKRPISGGPTINPMNEMDDTTVMAVAGDSRGWRPAARSI